MPPSPCSTVQDDPAGYEGAVLLASGRRPRGAQSRDRSSGGAFRADDPHGPAIGIKEVVNIGSLKLPYPFMGLAVRRSAIQQSPEIIRGFLRAFIAGLKVSIERAESVEARDRQISRRQEQEIIDEAYRSFAPLFPRVPYVTDEAIRAAIFGHRSSEGGTANPKLIFTKIVFCRNWKAPA